MCQKLYHQDLIANCDQDMKKTWRSLNTILKGKPSVDHIEKIRYEGNLITDPGDIGNAFNTFFTNIGPETQKNIPDVDSVTFDHFLESPLSSSLFLHPVTSDDILKKIMLLKNSSAGYDEISPIVIK